MIKKSEEKYIVLQHDNYGGLTVGSYSIKPGTIFCRSQWKGKLESLQKAVASKRCRLVKEKGKKNNSKSNLQKVQQKLKDAKNDSK